MSKKTQKVNKRGGKRTKKETRLGKTKKISFRRTKKNGSSMKGGLDKYGYVNSIKDFGKFLPYKHEPNIGNGNKYSSHVYEIQSNQSVFVFEEIMGKSPPFKDIKFQLKSGNFEYRDVIAMYARDNIPLLYTTLTFTSKDAFNDKDVNKIGKQIHEFYSSSKDTIVSYPVSIEDETIYSRKINNGKITELYKSQDKDKDKYKIDFTIEFVYYKKDNKDPILGDMNGLLQEMYKIKKITTYQRMKKGVNTVFGNIQGFFTGKPKIEGQVEPEGSVEQVGPEGPVEQVGPEGPEGPVEQVEPVGPEGLEGSVGPEGPEGPVEQVGVEGPVKEEK